MCPYHCGEWGSDSIRSLEWQFVQCLYDADKLHNFIEDNYFAFTNYPTDIQPLNPIFKARPENLQSEWYQRGLLPREYGGVTISNNYGCYDGWVILWKIESMDQPSGEHLGKIFHRKKLKDCWYNGITEDTDKVKDENGDEIDLDEAHRNDSDWNRCLCSISVEKGEYKFKNRIDFHNACHQLEQDSLAEVQDGTFRDTDYNPHFKREMFARFSQLSNRLQEARDSYSLIFEDCSRLHHAPSGEYELILQQFQKGDFVEAIDRLKDLLARVKLESLNANLASLIYTSKGEAEVETMVYDDAISSLSKAIDFDPLNKEAYFERAIAYFETGDFDLSLQDYLTKGKDIAFSTITQKADQWDLQSFGAGLMKGGIQGIHDASSEFLPSICNSIGGVGNFLWMTIQHPIETPRELAASTMEFCNYLRTCDKEELAQLLVPEMYELIVKWDDLYYDKRGELMGYCLGKYGVDILLPVAAVKGFKYVKTLNGIKKAEKLSALKTLNKSPESKEALAQASMQWSKQRQAYFAKVKLVNDSQTKHIPGSWNYDARKSIFTHPAPEKLFKENAGKGQKIKGMPGKPDYRERVDFGEIIGYFVDKDTKQKLPTTIGIIHYSKKGGHIVPGKPKRK